MTSNGGIGYISKDRVVFKAVLQFCRPCARMQAQSPKARATEHTALILTLDSLCSSLTDGKGKVILLVQNVALNVVYENNSADFTK